MNSTQTIKKSTRSVLGKKSNNQSKMDQLSNKRLTTEPMNINQVNQRKSLFSSTQVLNNRKSKEKEAANLSSNKKIPTGHVDLMK